MTFLKQLTHKFRGSEIVNCSMGLRKRKEEMKAKNFFSCLEASFLPDRLLWKKNILAGFHFGVSKNKHDTNLLVSLAPNSTQNNFKLKKTGCWNLWKKGQSGDGLLSKLAAFQKLQKPPTLNRNWRSERGKKRWINHNPTSPFTVLEL